MRFLLESRKLILLAAGIYIVLKLLFNFDIVSEYIQQITIYVFIVVLAATGLNVIYGYTGQFSLGHAAFYGIGAYTSAYLVKTLGLDSVFALPVTLLAGGVMAGLVAWIIGIPILRLRDDFLGIATLGSGYWCGSSSTISDRISETLGGSRGFTGHRVKLTNLEITFLVTVFLLIVTKNLISSRYGLFWRCIKDDETASASIGIDTTRMKLMAFSYGCFLAGVAGALYAHLYTFLHPSNFDFLKSIDFLIIVILGGMGNIAGTIWAGLIWVGFIEGLRIALPSNILDLRWVFIPLLLIALMMWRPYGLMSRKRGNG
jgi:branched-chain amino acid transport system permease protein